ncbi:MAG: hypothetical protein ABEI78_00865 [Candidatus Nanohaloarchaea archaeon]
MRDYAARENKILNQVSIFENKILTSIEGLIGEVSSDLNTPDVDIYLISPPVERNRNNLDDLNSEERLLALSIARDMGKEDKILSYWMPGKENDIERLNELSEMNKPLAKAAAVFSEERDNYFTDENIYYSEEFHAIVVKSLPDDYIPDHPEVLEPLIDYLKGIGEDQLKAELSMKLTKGYIQEITNYSSSKKVLKILQSAEYAIGHVYDVNIDEELGKDLTSMEEAMIQAAENQPNKTEAVRAIREESIEAIEELKENPEQDPAKFLEKRDEDFVRNLRWTAKAIEEAELTIIEALRILHIGPEKNLNLPNRLKDLELEEDIFLRKPADDLEEIDRNELKTTHQILKESLPALRKLLDEVNSQKERKEVGRIIKEIQGLMRTHKRMDVELYDSIDDIIGPSKITPRKLRDTVDNRDKSKKYVLLDELADYLDVLDEVSIRLEEYIEIFQNLHRQEKTTAEVLDEYRESYEKIDEMLEATEESLEILNRIDEDISDSEEMIENIIEEIES